MNFEFLNTFLVFLKNPPGILEYFRRNGSLSDFRPGYCRSSQCSGA